MAAQVEREAVDVGGLREIDGQGHAARPSVADEAGAHRRFRPAHHPFPGHRGRSGAWRPARAH